jgi:hypothetical protein
MKAILCALALLLSLPAFAEKWALLIGINDYEDRNYIASLGAADNDARRLKDVLKSKLGFPEANIELLVSDGDNKPTRANIVLALGKLAENTKPGDTVFVFYSGHGTEINGVTYLLPHDFKGRNKFTGTETALEIAKFKGLLAQVKAKALLMAWDMCRNDPFAKGKSGASDRPKLAQTKAWNIVSTARGSEAPLIVNLFACSPGECSYEWSDKNRGYFAWFLEEGIKGAAADSQGNITLGSLAKYVRTQVMTKTRAAEPTVQSPTSEMTGASPEEFVLLGGQVAINSGGGTAPTVKPSPGGGVKAVNTRSGIAFSGAPPGAKISVDKVSVKGLSYATDLLEPTQEVKVTVTAEGYRPKVVLVTLEQGKTVEVKIELERDEEEAISNAPPPTIGSSGSLQQVALAHNVVKLFQLPALQLVGSGQEKMDLVGTVDRYQQLVLVQHPATSRFRIEFTTKTKAIKAGFDGKAVWKRDPRPVRDVTMGEMYQLNPTQMLWYILRRLPELKPGKVEKGVLEVTDSNMKDARMLLTFGPDSLIQRIQIFLGTEELSFSFDKYLPYEGVPIPTTFRFVASKDGGRGTQYIFTGERLTRSGFSSDGYFAGGY